MASARIILENRKTLADGTHPVVLVLQIGGRRAYISTGVRCLAARWDEKNRRPRGISARERNFLDHLLATALQARLDLEQRRALTLDNWRDAIAGDQRGNTLGAHLQQRVDEMRAAGQLGNARIYENTLQKLRQTDRHRVDVQRLDYAWLQAWTRHMRTEGLRASTIAIHMRTLRALCNELIKRGQLSADLYPFRHYSVPRGEPARRALSLDDMRRLWRLVPDERNLRQRRAMHMLRMSFALCGINLVDLLAVVPTQLQGGRLRYVRQKTGTAYNIMVPPVAWDIYENNKGRRRWLAWGEGPGTAEQNALRQNNQVSIACRAIGRHLELEGLSYYTMRHTFATLARNLGYPRDLIAQALGHKINDTTGSYLADYDMKLVDDMQAHVLRVVSE